MQNNYFNVVKKKLKRFNLIRCCVVFFNKILKKFNLIKYSEKHLDNFAWYLKLEDNVCFPKESIVLITISDGLNQVLFEG